MSATTILSRSIAAGLAALVLGVAGTAFAVPQITGVSPANGPTAGGTLVTITGTDFGTVPGKVAFFHGSFTVVISIPTEDWSDTQVRVHTPAANPGACEIELRIGAVSSNHWSGFAYDLPYLTSLAPSSGPASGGVIQIHGENFGLLDAPTILLGGKSVIGQRLDHQRIVAFTPTLPPGQTVSVSVRVADGIESDALPYAVDGPVVDGFDPPFGPTLGGGPMTIQGQNFGTDGEDPLPVVRLGSIAAANVVRYDDNLLSCDTPPGAGLDRRLTVEVGTAVSPPSQQAYFFYPPEITRFDPPEAPFTGTVPITIHGTNFGPPGTSMLLFAPAMSGSQFIACDDVNQTTAVAHIPMVYWGEFGLFVDVEGQWSNTLPYTFRFFPEILSYGPYEGPTQGGTTLTVLGNEFGNVPGTVHLGPWTCPIDSWQNQSIVCRTPPGYGGEIFELTVETGAGISKPYSFTYESPQLLEVDPMFLDPAGGQVVTLRGTNFGIPEAPLFVEFANVGVPVVEWVSHQEVRVETPPGSPNQVGLACLWMGPGGFPEQSCEDFQYGNPVAVEPLPPQALPTAFALRLAGANPSRGATAFAVDLPRDALYALKLYDASGRLVRRLEGDGAAGTRAVSWDGADERGVRAPAGLYWARLEVAGQSFVRKVMRF